MTQLTDFQYAPFNGAESGEVRILRCLFVSYSTFGFSKCGLKAQWSTQPRASEAAPWVSRVGTVAP